MKTRRFLSLGTFLCTVMVYSQVGINTTDPATSLDITAKDATGSSTHVDGLLIPRVDRERAMSMRDVAVSTLIYVNSATTGTASGIAVNIDSVGYYYYNGTEWSKLNPAVSSADTNIYNTNGSLTGSRVVAQGDHTLAFTATAENAFSVDGTNLSVDASNHRVGIGTATPQKKLHVSGSIQLTDELNVGGSATAEGSAGTRGQVLTSGGGGVSPFWQKPKADVILGGMEAGGGIDLLVNGDNAFRYTGRYITLPPGKWIIHTSQLAQIEGPLNIDDWMFIRTAFSDENLSIGDIGTVTSDGSGTVQMGFRLKGPEAGLSTAQIDVFHDSVIVNNSSNSSKTYRYVAGNIIANRPISEAKIANFGGNWNENVIYAIAVE